MKAISCKSAALPVKAVASLKTSNLSHRSTKLAFVSTRKPSSLQQRQQVITMMARKESIGSLVATRVPNFQLTDTVTGETIDLYEYSKGAPATLLMFISNHCPFVIHLKPALAALAKEYQDKHGVKVIAIASNSIETHPQDGPGPMAEDAKQYGYTFPYVFDSTQEVAKQYQAACTPEFLVCDKDLVLQYHGQFDDTRPTRKGGDGREANGEDLRKGLDTVLAGKSIDYPVRPALGCGIKWTPGNEPAWYG